MTSEQAPAELEHPVPARVVGTSAAWAAASNIVMRLASIAVTALLTYLLSEEDFGVFAIALAVFLVVGSLAELGLGSAIARASQAPDDFAPTVVTLSVSASCVLGVAMAAAAGPIAGLLGQPLAAEPIRILSLCLALTGFFAVPGAQLVREFRQDRIFLATVAGFVVANPLLIVLALNGGDATSFAWSRVVGQLVTGAVMVASLDRRYRPGWRGDKVRGLLWFGLPLAAANLINWTLLNADYLIIATVLDAAEVGVYMIAFNVANWSTAVMSSVLNSVVVPAFGRVHTDPVRLGMALRTATRAVALLALPIGALTAVLATPLVHTLFSDNFSGAAPVLTVLSLYGVCYAFSLLFANILVATGRTVALLVVQVAWVAALVPAMLWGLRSYGLVGAAWAHVITIVAIALPVYAFLALRATDQRWVELARSVLGPALAAALSAMVALGVTLWLTTDWLVLVVGGALGSGVYLVLTWSTLTGALRQMRSPEVAPQATGTQASGTQATGTQASGEVS